MAVSRKVRKKHRFLKTFISLLVIIVIGFLCFYFITDLLKENKENIYKSQFPVKYSNYVEKYGKEYGVDTSLIYATIRTESKFDKNAKSSAGAMGLMQITEDTLHFLKNIIPNDDTDYKAEDLYDPETNIKFGTFFLSYLQQRYSSKSVVLAAYNAGFGNVDKWLSQSEYSKDGVELTSIPFPETSHYVSKVLKAEEYYKKLYG
ncbi:MAG: lytic transglycosylase domain-containing protein [Acutalibacteraceae bacterium]